MVRIKTLVVLLGVTSASCLLADDAAPTFTRDIAPMLTRLGCNTTKCHDALIGKGGLKLSPLASDLHHDYAALTHADSGRRVSRIDPANSLLLRRLTKDSSVKLTPDSEAYQTFLAWMKAGAPGPSETDPTLIKLTPAQSRIVLAKGEFKQIRVRAEWSDGVVRDVTDWCRFEIQEDQAAKIDDGLVTAIQPGRAVARIRFINKVAGVDVLVGFDTKDTDWTWESQNAIDDFAVRTWKEVGVPPAKLAPDHVFLRRTSLRLTGRVPDEQAARDFIESTNPTKRMQLVHELLASPHFVDHWSEFVTEWLLEDRRVSWESIPKALHQKSDRLVLRDWVRSMLRTDAPVAHIVRGVLTADGSTAENGAAVFYSAHQSNDDMARAFGQVFLGVSFRCTRCHDHPHAEWGMHDFYGIASAFSGVSVAQKQGEPSRVHHLPRGEFQNPRTGKVVKPAVFGSPLPETQDARAALADWLLSDGRKLLAKNIVNRIWTKIMGEPLTQWVDDVTPSATDRHRGLLDHLADDLVKHDFDLRHLLRTICQSRTYQLSSELEANLVDRWFGSRFTPTRLSTRELLVLLRQLTESNAKLTQPPDFPGASPFKESDTECSRGQYRNRTPWHSSIYLTGTNELQTLIRDPDGIIARLIKSDQSIKELTERLFFRVLNRKATAEEWKSISEHFKKADRKQYVEDLFWALVNTREFVLVH